MKITPGSSRTHAENNPVRASRPCPQCRRDTLVLTRRHTSPPQWGEPVVTEYYECECCDARYSYSPAQNRWRPLYQ